MFSNVENNIIYNKLEAVYSSEYNKYILFKDHTSKLNNYKKKIDGIKYWDRAKKLANPYELIFISGYKSDLSISKFKPLSRSYFKLIEIINKYNLVNTKNSIKIACLCEAPGAFTQALYNLRKLYKDELYSISLLDIDNTEVPNWNKLKDKKRLAKYVNISYGNLYNLNDINNFKENTGKVDFITADGGLDYSSDNYHQEQLFYKLIFGELLTALKIQCIGGTFILKIVDIMSILTIKIIYILVCLYDTVDIDKPCTSRPSNAEKYLICKGFRGISEELLNKLEHIFVNWTDTLVDIKNIDVPNWFIHKIYDYNNKYVENQCNYLDKIFKYADKKIEVEDYNNILCEQTKNAIKWCEENNIVINSKSIYYKKFMGNI